MDQDFVAEQLATFGNLEIEIGRECDVAVVWNGVFDWDSCSPPTFDDVEVKFLTCMRFAISSLCSFRGTCTS